MYRKLLSALLVLTMLLSIGLIAEAVEKGAISSNIGKQNYVSSADTVKSYLVPLEKGARMRVEALGEQVVVETYDSDFLLTDSLSIAFELPIFGGFYEGTDSYFLVFGQENLREDDSVETIRVVRYDKAWNRIASAAVRGTQTKIPFALGCLRMVQCGDFLYIRTCHKMYQEAFGVSSQSSLMISVRISTMQTVSAFYGSSVPGYVSRSLNQFVSADGNELISVDHGDVFPRSIVLSRFMTEASGRLSDSWEQLNVLPLPGKIGSGDTGVCIGGLAISKSAYLIAGSSIPSGSDNEVRNIFVSSIPKRAFSAEAAEQNWITDYPTDDSSYTGQVSSPQIVAVEDDFLLLWMAKETLCYTFLNQGGECTSPIMTADAALSDCKPVCSDGTVCWYCTDESQPVFYCIDTDAPDTVRIVETPEEDVSVITSEPTEPTEPTEPIQPQYECPSKMYTDVPGEGHWAHQGIDYAIQNGLFNGMSATLFQPEVPMTRAMLVAVLWRASGKAELGSNPFSDVPEKAWYTDAVRWASACSIVNGVGAGRFDPDGNITREQMATIIYRYAMYCGKDTSQRAELSKFADRRQISNWAEDAMCWSVAKGIISGAAEHGTIFLLPGENATRAQVATILMRYLQNE